MHRKFTVLGALAVMVLGLTAMASVSYAQYPPPAGGVSVQAASTTVSAGGTTTLTCIVTASDGTGVPNTPCTFTITSEPGTDAGLDAKTVTKLTDSQGMVTDELHVGSTPGVIVVQVSAAGFESSVLVTVEGTAPSPPQAPVGGSAGIQPPSTGDGGLLGSAN